MRAEPLGRAIEQCVRPIFPTPVALHLWPDSDELNAALGAMIAREAAASPGLARSNVGGWHSPMDFLDRDDPTIDRLVARIRTMIGALTGLMMKPGRHRFEVVGWANLLRAGQYNGIHTHPNATWSGVYYVTGNPPPAQGMGDPAFSGKIELIDPRPGASASFAVENVMQQRTLLNPDAGAMLVFPSWLPHLVHPYFGPDARISIAFNVLVTDGDSGGG